MSSRALAVIAVSLAVVAAAVAAIVVSTRRADEAKAYAEAEAAQADAEAAQAKTERAQADAEIAKRKAAEANAQAEKDKKAAAQLAKETAQAEAKAAEAKKAAAEASAEAERAKAESLRAVRDTARATNETARIEQQKTKDLAAAEQAKAEAEATRLATEKLKSDRIIAEAKALELRKIDYETLERDLMEWKLDLEERERALKPEKTISDLAWAGGMEDTVIDEKGNLKKQARAEYNPENDMSLPEQSRRLARTERQMSEMYDQKAGATRSAVVKSMERLYVGALKDGRAIDAEFYRKSLQSMYPDWTFKGEKTE